MLAKYANDTRKLFRAAVEIALLGCEDRVLPVYLFGLKILITAMSSPICDKKVTKRMINDALRMFFPLLFDKISELNSRARDISMHTLIELFRNPRAQTGPLVEYIMVVAAPGELPVQKQPWRAILARLEILLHVVQEYGVTQDWKWQEVFNKLLLPCLEHANADIRNTAIEVIVAMYQSLGMQFRLVVDSVEKRLRPQLAKRIYERMLQVDQTAGEHMPVILEEEETKGLLAKPSNAQDLKDKINTIVEEERRKRH